MNTMRIGILIPAYQPDERMVAFVRACVDAGFEVTVINDGSTEGLDCFEEAASFPGVTVEGYADNCGKGHALKTGLAAMRRRGYTGVITADADGQHSVADIQKVAAALEARPDTLILGSRDTEKMPPKSRTGNRMTRRLFGLLYGIRLSDTQTGLRGIPLTGTAADGLLSLPGERYEYEMEMLRESAKLFPGGILEVPIETIYFENNSGTHFRPLRDGGRIYAVLLKSLPVFLLSSLAAFGVDYGFFNTFFYALSLGTIASTVLARLISATVNYTVNKYGVFRADSGKTRYNLKNYALLAAAILAVNSALMYFFVNILGLPAFVMKILVESGLYIISFTVQQRLAAGKGGQKQAASVKSGKNTVHTENALPLEKRKDNHGLMFKIFN